LYRVRDHQDSPETPVCYRMDSQKANILIIYLMSDEKSGKPGNNVDVS